MKRIVVLDDWERNFQTQAASQADWALINGKASITTHHQTLRGQALSEAVREAQGLVLTRDRTALNAELIAQMPELEYVVFTGARNTQLDFAALAARNIPVSYTAFGPSKESTAELTWALILGSFKRMEQAAQLMRSGQWRPESATSLPILAGQRMGFIGLGEIGGRVAKVAQAFGMEVICWSPNMTAERAAAKGATFVGLDELISTSRIISLHLVPSPATKQLINAPRLTQMRPDALLVNTSRAALIDSAALLTHLQNGKGFAALDVYDQEPLPANHPLRSLPNATLSPHLGFVCEPVLENFDVGVAQCLAAWLSDAPLIRTIAPP